MQAISQWIKDLNIRLETTLKNEGQEGKTAHV
jgi:hypothetical protein